MLPNLPTKNGSSVTAKKPNASSSTVIAFGIIKYVEKGVTVLDVITWRSIKIKGTMLCYLLWIEILKLLNLRSIWNNILKVATVKNQIVRKNTVNVFRQDSNVVVTASVRNVRI